MLLEDQARSGCITVVVVRQSSDQRASSVKFEPTGVDPESFHGPDNRHLDVRS